MKKFYLTIYNSALLLLLVVQYSESHVIPSGYENFTSPEIGGPVEVGGPVAGYPTAKTSDANSCQFSMEILKGAPDLLLPLLLTPSGQNTDFVYPLKPRDKIIKVEKTARLRLACPGKDNIITGLPDKSSVVSVAEVECGGANTFVIGTKSFKIDDIVCKLPPAPETRRTERKCLEKLSPTAKYVEIGFSLKPDEFLKTIDVCWEDSAKKIYWVQSVLTEKSLSGQTMDTNKVRFGDNNFHGDLNLNDLYSSNGQVRAMTAMTGSYEASKKFINEELNNNLLITRGHLVPKKDFVYGSAQLATFSYINVAPQWYNFNSGNWGRLESDLRNFVSKRNKPVTTYTGTHGQMVITLNDEAKTKVPFYMQINSADPSKKSYPVQEIFWKIIHDPLTKKGTAFIGFNDPWATPENPNGIKTYCQDISKKLKWLDWKSETARDGLSYSCEINEAFKKLIPTLPTLDVSGGILIE